MAAKVFKYEVVLVAKDLKESACFGRLQVAPDFVLERGQLPK